MRAPSGRAAWLTVALGTLLWVNNAHAEPRDEAKRYFLQGLEAAKAQDFEGALEKFEAAQDIYPHPATIYNIARAHQDLGNLEEAIFNFKYYAEMVPEKEAALALAAYAEAKKSLFLQPDLRRAVISDLNRHRRVE